MKYEEYSPRTYADLIVKRILGFIPTKLSIKEIEDKEK